MYVFRKKETFIPTILARAVVAPTSSVVKCLREVFVWGVVLVVCVCVGVGGVVLCRCVCVCVTCWCLYYSRNSEPERLGATARFAVCEFKGTDLYP